VAQPGEALERGTLPVPTERSTPADAATLAEPLTPDAARSKIAGAVPEPVLDLLRRLWAAGHAAYVVGGSLRDVLLDRPAADWDLATDARPDEILAIFPDATYENQFGTVGVRRRDGVHEITTFRSEHEYADFRRPHRVEFGDRIEDDLARRDFTINALAWGGDPGPDRSPRECRLVDPHGGLADLAARRIRAVGNPLDRFGEDALRMVRAIRLAAVLEFEIEPETLAAIRERADLVRHLSGERVAAELTKLLAARRPSIGLRLLETTGLLERLLPELAAERGIPQAKVPGDDLWAHTLRTVDAAPADRPIVRLAALLHDVGKPETAADGHFPGHEVRGAELTEALLRRLRLPRETIERVAHLVRHHMFSYEGAWSDAAVRRFIARIGRDALDELFALRRADNVGSGLPAEATGVAELEARVTAILAGPVVLDRRDLAVDGDDLITELGLEPGPRLGRILDALLERVVADPSLNERPTLLLLARSLASGEGE
jgi:putative nucleotidyltransferase with HDIG domain